MTNFSSLINYQLNVSGKFKQFELCLLEFQSEIIPRELAKLIDFVDGFLLLISYRLTQFHISRWLTKLSWAKLKKTFHEMILLLSTEMLAGLLHSKVSLIFMSNTWQAEVSLVEIGFCSRARKQKTETWSRFWFFHRIRLTAPTLQPNISRVEHEIICVNTHKSLLTLTLYGALGARSWLFFFDSVKFLSWKFKKKVLLLFVICSN